MRATEAKAIANRDNEAVWEATIECITKRATKGHLSGRMLFPLGQIKNVAERLESLGYAVAFGYVDKNTHGCEQQALEICWK